MMNGFTAADMSTAAANGFRDGLAAQPAAAQEAVAVWTVTREGDPTFPRAYFSEAAADAMVAHITLAPFAVKRAPVAAAPVDGWDAQAYRQMSGELESWKQRALTAEGDFNRLHHAMNAEDGPTHMGEPVLSTPAAPGIDLEQFRDAVIVARSYYADTAGDLNDPTHKDVAVCDRLLALIDASPKGGIDACAWAGDGEGNWYTACGEIFTLMEGSPADNKMHHCPYCGKNLMTTGTDVCVAVIGDSYEDTRSEAHDAARYRWLRNHYEPSFHDSECDSLIGLHGEDLDDAIDDEMQATSAEVGA